VEVELPFEPVFWAIDPNDKMGDACFKYTQILNKTGTANMIDGCFRVQVNDIEGEAVLRVEHNLVAPTPAKKNHPNIFRVSEKHFWRIGFLQKCDLQAKYLFSYNYKKDDAELLQGYYYNDLILLYRKDASCNWQILSDIVSYPDYTTGIGTITADYILPGEYTLGVGEYVSVNEWEAKIEVYPNPTTGELRITNSELLIAEIEIFDVFGRKVGAKFLSNEMEGGRPRSLSAVEAQPDGVVVNISYLCTGIYFVKVKTEAGEVIKKITKH
jgi:hypothetical protein